ncbi:family 1 glycosylhydrolase [Deinococcus multiflagellatus]|uniref:family 1 glycosylhydrolase n=1 Tax=Deinococcus multiflagellatus TaxID=1656887 RepID=UPI001CC9985A|nr:family 1 glycosylhydrolase [Deinococcus multiflagellatus]MBZ9713944.1 family 1 glycosylhydrolase [Deinococcus multiflagellatus]
MTTFADSWLWGVGLGPGPLDAADLGLLRELGVQAACLTAPWAQLQPTGRGRLNAGTLAALDRLTDDLLTLGAQPWLSLDGALPPAVDAAGGWLARDTAHRFQDYAYLVGEALADRAAAVFTLWPALGTPPAPPALHSFPAHHHRLLGHGLATRALREAGARQLGLGHHFAPAWPARDHDADEQAAALVAAWRNDLCTGPVRRGAYPAPVLEVLGERTPALLDAVRPGDLETIAAPLDLLGVGYDQPAWVQARPGAPLGLDVGLVPDRERTGAPGSEGLTQVLTDLKAQLGEAGPPLVVALGGVWAEAPLPDGRVPDSGRVRFLEGHVQAVADAAARGVGVRGVLVGELLDRGEGLGLVRVDGGTGERVRKGSFGWVAGVVRGG